MPNDFALNDATGVIFPESTRRIDGGLVSILRVTCLGVPRARSRRILAWSICIPGTRQSKGLHAESASAYAELCFIGVVNNVVKLEEQRLFRT